MHKDRSRSKIEGLTRVALLVFRQEDRGTGAHNMGTCPLARLSLLSMAT